MYRILHGLNMYSEDRIKKYYNRYKKISSKMINSGNYNEAMYAMHHASSLMHLFNFILYDKEMEEMLSEVGLKVLGDFAPYEESGAIVLYDSIAIDNMALSYQYLAALSKMEIPLYYIIYSDKFATNGCRLKKLACSSENCHLIEVNRTDDYMNDMRHIKEIIADIKPSKILLHMSNNDVVGTAVFSNINCTRFYINHGDDQFWLGMCALDYIIEFRGMGLDTSLKYRNALKKQCLVNPYYPIIDNTGFAGFEFKIPEGAVKLFSGGRFVKVYAENGKFLDVVKNILLNNDSAFFIFAGSGDKTPMLRYIYDNGLKDRWKVIDYRKDLYGVMKNVDIYLGTYPQSGGLMTQYAVVAGTPIVEMDTKNGGVAEDLLKNTYGLKITMTEWPEYFDLVAKLIDDSEYRREFSDKLRQSVYVQEDFENNLKQIINENTSAVSCVMRDNNVKLRAERLLEAENKYLHRVPGIMCNKLFFRYYPLTTLKCILEYIKNNRFKKIRRR